MSNHTDVLDLVHDGDRPTEEKPADQAGLILSSRCLGYYDANQHWAGTIPRISYRLS